MKTLTAILDLDENAACGYAGRVLRTNLCPMGRVNKAMDNKKTLPTAIAHTHRSLAHIPTRLNNEFFLIITKPTKATPILRQRFDTVTILRQQLSLRQ